MKIEYLIIVKNKTRLEILIERFNTKAQAEFYIQSMGGDFKDYVDEHESFHKALSLVQTRISKIIKYKIVERTYLSSFIFSENHLILVIGQDGLVANTAKYSRGVPIIAVNPDKSRYDGVLLPFDVSNFMSGLENILKGEQRVEIMRFAEAKLNDGQRILAFNDLFIGASSHISARYRLSYQGNKEEHSSSGLIVSTKAGSTGWLSSIFNMAFGINKMFDSNLKSHQPKLKQNDLLFVVREPFKSVRTQIDLTTGIINQSHQLKIESLMPANGVIFSDGIEKDYLRFNSGSIVTIGLAEEKAKLVVNHLVN